MDWSRKGILVPDSHVNNRNHSLHWELCWLFFTFSVSIALSGQILSTSHSQPLPAKEIPWNIFPEEHVWFHRYWHCPHRLFSSPYKEWGEHAKGHQMYFTLLSVWKLWRNHKSWVMEQAGYCSKEAKVFSHSTPPNQDPSQGRSFTCCEPVTHWDGRTVGRGVCAVFSVNKERGFKLLEFLSCEFCFLFSSNRDIYGKGSKNIARCSWSCISPIQREHEWCTPDCRLNKSISHTSCILRLLNLTFLIILMLTLTLSVQISSLTDDLLTSVSFFLTMPNELTGTRTPILKIHTSWY